MLVVDITQRMRLHRQLIHHLLGMSAQNDHLARCQTLCVQFVAGLDEIAHALVLVGDALRGEENQFLVKRQPESFPCLLPVTFLIDMRVDGVGDTRDLLSPQQCTGLSL